jgi:hypothetical protein
MQNVIDDLVQALARWVITGDPHRNRRVTFNHTEMNKVAIVAIDGDKKVFEFTYYLIGEDLKGD